MSDNKAKTLLEKYNSDQLSEEDKALVEKWLLNYQEEGEDLSPESIEAIEQDLWNDLRLRKSKPKALWPRIAVAAGLFFTISIGLLFHLNQDSNKLKVAKKTIVNDIIPGGNKAILTLANGKNISLTDADNGELVQQSGIKISKTSDGQLVYQVIEDPAHTSNEIKYNTVKTPRGGQYQIILPDGSRVWLNAATVLKFPLSFRDLNERKVELKGEAYFEVEKDLQKPFIVQSDKQLIKVLGTHFNISSYADEPNTKTTLVEGSVRVEAFSSLKKEFCVLLPGQQAQTFSAATGIQVTNVDVQAETAWKNGYFSFEDASLETIMKQIARWYDVDVIYKDNLAGKTVWGSITRYSNVSKVLSILEKTGKVHFKVEGRRIIVSK